jgi:hypothetical protein
MELSDVLANAYLIAGDAKTDSKGLVRVTWAWPAAIISSYDDYLYIEQTIEMPDGWDAVGGALIEKKALKEAGPEGFWDLVRENENNDDGQVAEIFDELGNVLHQFAEALLTGFRFPSDRFAKVSRIKGEEPVDLMLGEDNGMKFAKFTKGHVQGLLSFLEEDRDNAVEAPEIL